MLLRNLRVRDRLCPRPGCSGQGIPVVMTLPILQWYVNLEKQNLKTELIYFEVPNAS
jgi:hypothetical protein